MSDPPPFGVDAVGSGRTPPGPLIQNVPLRRNQNFIGRANDIQFIEKIFISEIQHECRWIALWGLGGVGKTQIALEYIYRNKDNYKVIWWLRSEEPGKLHDDYIELGRVLGLDSIGSSDRSGIVKAVRDSLEDAGHWLLVFDNADNPESLADFIPVRNGNVLVTTRNPNWGDIVQVRHIRVWPRSESIDYLCQRTSELKKDVADALADALGDLPLALAQACAYIAKTGETLDRYLELFTSRRKDLWGREERPFDYNKTVTATWSMAIHQIRRTSPEAARLLEMVADLDRLPYQVTSPWSESLEEGWPIPSSSMIRLQPSERIPSSSAAEIGFSSILLCERS